MIEWLTTVSALLVIATAVSAAIAYVIRMINSKK